MSKSANRRDDHLEESLEQLQREHQQLEHRLMLLRRPRSMSPQEHVEELGIKKRKLAIKDRLMSMQHQ
jgi:hypothetical protein